MDKKLIVIAHNIRSLYNVGAIFRLCDGVGVSHLYLTGATGAPHMGLKYQRQRHQIAKTALASLEALPWTYVDDIQTVITDLKQQGFTILALEQTSTSQDYRQIAYTSPVALILGNEVAGVDDQTLAAVDGSIELPMHGAGKSLNVATAASAALYHISSQLKPAV